MNDSFTPNMGTYTNLTPFRFWCQKVLPFTYDNSLSYYELLCKVVDYLNKTMEDVDTAIEDMEKLYDAYDELQAFVTDYFDNLDVQEEINTKLDEMAEDGSLDALFLPYFNAYRAEINGVLEELDSAIEVLEGRVDTFASLPDGSTAGDAELEDIRVGGNGVTYSTAGDAVRAQYNINALRERMDNRFDYCRQSFNVTNNGITFERLSDGRIHVYGTATANAHVQIFGSTLGFTYDFGPGSTLAIKIDAVKVGTQTVNYINGQQSGTAILRFGDWIAYIGESLTAFEVRLRVNSGTTIDEYINVHIYKVDKTLDAFIRPPKTSALFHQNILSVLRYVGRCVLIGDYTIETSISMPENTSLIGYNASITFSGTSCITMRQKCKVEGLEIVGQVEELIVSDSITDRSGIIWEGEDRTSGIIENCIFRNIDGAGIRLRDTGTPVDRNLTISNCFIHHCNAGIYIQRDSEFNRIIGCCIEKNYYGVLNRGGNNYIGDCNLDANTINVQIDQAEGSNGGHGGICNCSLNHAGGNTGYSLIIKSPGLMMISNCNFYFGKIRLEGTEGNVINACGFGRQTGIEIIDGNCNLMSNCILRTVSDTPFTIENNTKSKIINCFYRNGNAVTL